MARGEPSAADVELIGRLAALDVVVSAAQLERWRGLGLLPRHARVWLGRGRGSVSVLAEETVAAAAVLGRHARAGRDVRWTVIAWYAEAGRPVLPGQLAVPEPPWPAVREALVWAMRRSTAQRLVESARTAARGSEEEQDAFYTEAGRVVGRGHAGPAHPEVMRRVLEDPEAELDQGEDRRRRRGAVSMVAAVAMGAGEVGGERLVDALVTLMPGLDWTGVAADARQAEEAGEFDGWIRGGAVDPLGLLHAAGPEEMAAARHAAMVLAGVGGLYLMHGLGMPDNPALARLRAVLEESGLSLVVAQMVPMMIDPSGIVHALTMCLAPRSPRSPAGWSRCWPNRPAPGRGCCGCPVPRRRNRRRSCRHGSATSTSSLTGHALTAPAPSRTPTGRGRPQERCQTPGGPGAARTGRTLSS
ncbi:hypothetical protein [Streptomyces sp. I5]|uniref:hypothetical protein n=1 Tax=Streptomyces sp. I5 TaxID=2759947 RepID=UPI0018EE4904|nr:hypothetical protein [Streptomyces sp. I5]MBJ6636736.1 hypothetical protein [Streptomyces sp. I5]